MAKEALETLETVGKPVKDFSLPATGGSSFRLSDQRGRKRVRYFYPRDNTPLYRISRDSLQSRERFKAKMKFPFELYGKQVRGIERSTLVVDAKRVPAREWRGVKVPGHIQEVLNFAKAL